MIVRMLAVVVAMLALGLAGACGGDSSSAPQTPGSGNITQASHESFTPSPVGQFLLDEASVEVRQNTEYSYTIIATLPTGNTAETTFTLDPGRGDPGSGAASGVPGSPLQAFHLSYEVTAEGMEWRYEYVVPRDTFPAYSFVAARDGEAPGWLSQVALGLLEPRSAYAQEGGGVQVVADGVHKEFGKEGIAQVEEGMGLEGSPLTEIGDAILNFAEALETRAEYQELKRRLAELRKCAENPTNPLTKKMYEEVPGSKQSILDEISRAEPDIKADVIVRFIGALNSQASGLAGVKWLGFVVGPLTSWADGEIKRLGEEKVKEIEKLVTKCEGAVWSGTITFTMVDRYAGDAGSETSESVCCGGQKTEHTYSYERSESLAATWEVNEGILPDDGGPLFAAYTLDASEQNSSESYRTGWASCRGGHRPQTWHSRSETETSEAKFSGEAEVYIVVSSDGSYSISASPPNAQVVGTTEIVETSSDDWGCGDTEGPDTTTHTGTYRPGDPSVDIAGEMDPNNPNELSGSKKETLADGKTTITYTWHLTRETTHPDSGS